MFDPQSLADKYTPRSQDAGKDLFLARVTVCASCPALDGHTCAVASQLCSILARRPNGHCPDRKWPGDPPAVTRVPRPPQIPPPLALEADTSVFRRALNRVKRLAVRLKMSKPAAAPAAPEPVPPQPAAVVRQRPLRVGLITPCFGIGGVEHQWLALCRYFTPESGVVPAGLALTGDHALDSGMLEAASRFGPVFGLSRLETPELATRRLCDCSDVIMTWGDWNIAQYVAGFQGPVVLVSHGSANWTRDVLAAAIKNGAPTHFVAVSEVCRDVYPDSHKERVTIIPNGIDLDHCAPTIDPPAKVPGASLNIGYVGRVSSEKNPSAAARAAVELTRRGTPATAIYHCPDSHAELLDKALAGLPCVRRTGPVGDTFSQLDCLVAASHDEGASLLLLEAMAAGIPIVATPVGDLPRLERQHGPIVERVPLDPPANVLADAVIAARDPRNADRIARGRRAVWNHHSAARMAADWRRYLQEVAGRASAP